MGDYGLFMVVLTFATISGTVVVFVLNMLIRKEERDLKRFQDLLLCYPGILGQIFRYPKEDIDLIQDKRGDFIRKIDKELIRYQKNSNRTLDNGICKIYISHSVWDNILDISTADIKRVKNMLDRYKKGFEFVFAKETYARKFYLEILERLKPEEHKRIVCFIIVFLLIMILLISGAWFITCYNLYVPKSSVLFFIININICPTSQNFNFYVSGIRDILSLKNLVLSGVAFLCIILQIFLIFITYKISVKRRKSR